MNLKVKEKTKKFYTIELTEKEATELLSELVDAAEIIRKDRTSAVVWESGWPTAHGIERQLRDTL